MPKLRSLDINQAFLFIFQDPQWLRKFVIAGLLSLTLVGAIPVQGWLLEMQRRLIQTGKSSLPEWDALGEYSLHGFKFMLAWMIVFLPLPLLYFSAFFFASKDQTALALLMTLFQLVGVMASVALLILMGIVSARYAETHSLRQTFELPWLLSLLRANWKQFLAAALLGYIASYAALFAGYILLCVGVFFTNPIGMAIMLHLYAQAYRHAKALAG